MTVTGLNNAITRPDSKKTPEQQAAKVADKVAGFQRISMLWSRLRSILGHIWRSHLEFIMIAMEEQTKRTYKKDKSATNSYWHSRAIMTTPDKDARTLSDHLTGGDRSFRPSSTGGGSSTGRRPGGSSGHPMAPATPGGSPAPTAALSGMSLSGPSTNASPDPPGSEGEWKLVTNKKNSRRSGPALSDPFVSPRVKLASRSQGGAVLPQPDAMQGSETKQDIGADAEDTKVDPQSELSSIDDCQRHQSWAEALNVWSGSLCRQSDAVRAVSVTNTLFDQFYDRVLRAVPLDYIETTVAFDDSRSLMTLEAFLKVFKKSDNKPYSPTDQVKILHKIKNLEFLSEKEGLKRPRRGNLHAEQIAAGLHCLANCWDAVADQSGKPAHPIQELPDKSICDDFKLLPPVMAVSKRCCPGCHHFVCICREQPVNANKLTLFSGNHSDWWSVSIPPWTPRWVADLFYERIRAELVERFDAIIYPNEIPKSGPSGGSIPSSQRMDFTLDQDHGYNTIVHPRPRGDRRLGAGRANLPGTPSRNQEKREASTEVPRHAEIQEKIPRGPDQKDGRPKK